MRCENMGRLHRRDTPRAFSDGPTVESEERRASARGHDDRSAKAPRMSRLLERMRFIAFVCGLVLVLASGCGRTSTAQDAAKAEALLNELPVFPGSRLVATRADSVQDNSFFPRTVGFLSDRVYKRPGQASAAEVHAFDAKWLRSRGWRGSDVCDAFYVRGTEHLEIISCPNATRFWLRAWVPRRGSK
jgi:hypothetical protein